MLCYYSQINCQVTFKLGILPLLKKSKNDLIIWKNMEDVNALLKMNFG